MIKRLLLTLIVIVTISGCIGQGPTITGGPGLIITDFSPDYSDITAGETVGLNLEVENQGEFDTYIYRITWFGVDMSQSGWDLSGIGNPDTLAHYIVGTDPTVGFEGGAWFETRTITAPSSIKSITTFDLGVRVEYLYQTDFSATIRIMSPEYLRTLSKEDREAMIRSGGIRDSSSSAAPITLKAASGRHFLATEDTQTIKVPFKVTNIGPGLPYDSAKKSVDDALSDGLYKIKILGESGITCDDSSIVLSRGKNGGFACDLDIPEKENIINFEDRTFSLSLLYMYYVDGSTSITVNPQYQ